MVNKWDQVQAGLVLHKLDVYSSPLNQLSISYGPDSVPWHNFMVTLFFIFHHNHM